MRSLVGFGTRHTLSDTLSPTRGIGAARRWIHARFDSHLPRLRRLPRGAGCLRDLSGIAPGAGAHAGGQRPRYSARDERPRPVRPPERRHRQPRLGHHERPRLQPGRQRQRERRLGGPGGRTGPLALSLPRIHCLRRPLRGREWAPRRADGGRHGQGEGLAPHRGHQQRHDRQHGGERRHQRHDDGPCLLGGYPPDGNRFGAPGPARDGRRGGRQLPPARALHQGGRRPVLPFPRRLAHLPARPLRPRRAPPALCRSRLSRGPPDGGARELHPPAPGYPGRERRGVRGRDRRGELLRTRGR